MSLRKAIMMIRPVVIAGSEARGLLRSHRPGEIIRGRVRFR